MSPETDRPTYEALGRLERYDERDNVFSRERLAPGSPEEVAYHTAYPEHTEVDRHIARFILQAEEPTSRPSQQIESAYYQALFGSIASLGLPDSVDGPIASRQVETDPPEMARRIKDLALRLGANMVRIGPLNQAWVYSHRGTPPFFPDYRPNAPHFSGVPRGYTDLNWGDPIDISHSYAVSLAFRQDHALIGTSPSAECDFENGRLYAKSALLAVQLARYIRGLGWPARAHHMRNYGVLLVPVAVDAGIGELGRCGYVVSPEFGTNSRLAAVTTDLPMTLDRPRDLGVQDCCTRCAKCARNCPPHAIPTGGPAIVRGVRKWQVNAEKCLLYWGRVGAACAICQMSCPWSKPPSLFHTAVARAAISIPRIRPFLIRADDWVYGRRYRAKRMPTWAR